MTDKKTWLITGAGRGMGLEFAKAALAAGKNVVGTGRNPDRVKQAIGDVSVRSASQRCAKAEPVVPESLLPDLGWH